MSLECKICNKEFININNHEKHIIGEKHLLKLEKKKQKLSKKSFEYLNKKYGMDNINSILNTLSGIEINKEDSLEFNFLSSKESLRQQIHSIHNFLRNNGIGYGMSALKVFTIIYGLKKIEINGHFEKTKLSEICKFSNIKKIFEEDSLNGFYKFYNDVLDEIYSNDNVKNFLAYEISSDINADILYEVIKKIDKLVNDEKKYNFQLSGKIYEYFIGRDQTAISELGAYFTDRPITNFIYEKLLKPKLNKDNSVKTLIDPF
jgi:hypothetical protein